MMDAANSNLSEDVWLYARLDAFLEALAGQGISVDIAQRVRLIGFMAQLSAKSALPRDGTALSRLLTPIIAGSPAEQEICHDLFKSWFEDSTTASVGTSDFNAALRENVFQKGENIWDRHFSLTVKLFLIAMAILVFVIAAQKVNFWNSQELTHVEEAERVSPLVLSPQAQLREWLDKYPIEALAVPKQSLWNRSWRWYFTEFDSTKTVVALLPWAAYLAAVGWLVRLIVLRLRRDLLRQSLHSVKWHFQRVSGQFGNRFLLAKLQPLRSLARETIKVFDAEKTILETARCGGLLQARFSELPIVCDFVALIDRRSSRDHLAEHNRQIVRVLQDAGIFVEIFEFDEDPVLCRSARTGDHIGLQEVLDKFSTSVFLFFVEPDQAVDPVTGRLKQWVSLLTSMPKCFLLSTQGPPTVDIQDVHGKCLPKSIDLSPEGLVDLVERLGANARPARSRSPSTELLVEFLNERPERWLQQTRPAREDLNRLLELMHRSFDERDFQWVAASALYPLLNWPLTTALKSALKDGNGRLYYDRGLLIASMLPWFRQGWMPDWLRTALQGALSHAQVQNVRRELVRAMGLRSSSSNAELEIDFKKDKSGKPPTADRVLAEFILPSLHSPRRLFTVPATFIASRKLLRNFLFVSATGAMIAMFCSYGALSVLPIDECDLLAASRWDPQRVGAPVDAWLTIRVPAYGDKVLAACQSAIQRHPENLRFQYNYVKPFFRRSPTQFFEKAAESAAAGYPAGFDLVADCYLLGHGTEKNYVKAEANYRKAVDLGVTAAYWGLYLLYKRSDFEHFSMEEAFKFAKLAVDQAQTGYADLAKFYRDGGPVEADPGEYIALLKKGVRHHDSDASRQLGLEYYAGKYVPRDHNRANELISQAALWSADPEAAYELGISNSHGRGMPVNFQKATFWLIFAARLGNPYALFELSNLVLEGTARFDDRHAPHFPNLAFKRIAAEGGRVDAQYALAVELENLAGDDVAKKQEAIDWYRRAAAKGSADAESALKRLKIPLGQTKRRK